MAGDVIGGNIGDVVVGELLVGVVVGAEQQRNKNSNQQIFFPLVEASN